MKPAAPVTSAWPLVMAVRLRSVQAGQARGRRRPEGRREARAAAPALEQLPRSGVVRVNREPALEVGERALLEAAIPQQRVGGVVRQVVVGVELDRRVQLAESL